MKTVFINGSPKKSFSASAYFIAVQSFFTQGNKIRETLRNQSDHERILETLKDAHNVVFCLPLYVDGIPSHVLAFMKVLVQFCKDNNLHLNVYVITNCGYIEGKQSEPLMQNFENFCVRSGLNWCGGFGVGGGVMLNVLRIVFLVQVGLLFLNIFLSVINSSNWLPVDAFVNFATNALTIGFFNLGVFLYSLKMGLAMGKGCSCGKHYTRIMIPSFIFILFADIFFVIISVFQGGFFKGWLAKK